MAFEMISSDTDNAMMLLSYSEMVSVIHPTMEASGMGAWGHPHPELEEFDLRPSRQRCRIVGSLADLRAYDAAWADWSRYAEADFADRGRGIPLHKLSSNDDWQVTPGEIASALPHAPAEAFWPDGRRAKCWAGWLAFLRAAAPYGFSVS